MHIFAYNMHSVDRGVTFFPRGIDLSHVDRVLMYTLICNVICELLVNSLNFYRPPLSGYTTL